MNNDTLLARWLSNELTEAEKLELERHPDFPAYRRLVEATDRLALPDAGDEAMWKNLQARLAAEPEPKPAGRIRQLWWWTAVAAAIVSLLLWALPRLQPSPPSQGVATSAGKQKTVRFPDGSTCRLNAASAVDFSTGKWKQERVVRLEGEAFFDVQKLEAPFRVETANGSVTVVGTMFSVAARSDALRITCFSGRVLAQTPAGAGQPLSAGQAATSVAGKWSAVHSAGDGSPSWMRGESRFENAPLQEVFDELERQYGVTVDAPGAEQRVFTGAFVHGNLPTALRMICAPMGLNYTVDGQTVRIESK